MAVAQHRDLFVIGRRRVVKAQKRLWMGTACVSASMTAGSLWLCLREVNAGQKGEVSQDEQRGILRRAGPAAGALRSGNARAGRAEVHRREEADFTRWCRVPICDMCTGIKLGIPRSLCGPLKDHDRTSDRIHPLVHGSALLALPADVLDGFLSAEQVADLIVRPLNETFDLRCARDDTPGCGRPEWQLWGGPDWWQGWAACCAAQGRTISSIPASGSPLTRPFQGRMIELMRALPWRTDAGLPGT